MPTRQEIKERRRRKQKQQRLTIILFVGGGALILAAILMIPTISGALTPLAEFEKPALSARPMANANTMGDPNAPVVIEEFSDFGCNHCANFGLGNGEIIAEEYVATGKVYFTYRSVGSLLGHPNSTVTAEAAYCAGDQNKFWEFHDLIFANQGTLFANMNTSIDRNLSAFAEYLELDMNAYDDCLSSNKFRTQVQQDLVDAQQAGVNSTPSFLINGELVIGNRPIEEFRSSIDAELAKTGN